MFRVVNERALRQYLEEISRYKLLTRKEEFELAKKVREENDPEAKEKLICANLRIVVYIAKKFQHQGLSLSELINAGNEGLIHAAEKFDERKGYRFNTYSVWWIKRSIFEAINTQRGIVPKSPLAKRLQRETTRFIQHHGREPTLSELARIMKLDEAVVSLGLSELIPPYSLDETFGEGKSSFVESFRLDIEKANNLITPSPEEIFRKKVQKEKLEKSLARLNPREREVLKRNFGLDAYEPQSLEGISRMMNITRERVRQIKENALRKLKSIMTSQKL